MDQHRQAFKEEAYELLGELETSLLELEELPEDAELIGRVFRAMHTIKGSGAMFGFDDIAAFTHQVETVFDQVRDGRIFITKEIVDLTLSACDQIKKMVDGEATVEEKAEEIVQAFKKLLHNTATSEETADPSCRYEYPPTADEPQKEITCRIRFRPALNILSSGTNPILLLDELRALGECKVAARTDAVPLLKDLNPEACYLYWDIILTTRSGIDAVKDVFIFVEDDSELRIEIIDEEGILEAEEDFRRLGEILVEKGDLSSDELTHVLESKKRIGEMLVEAKMVDQAAVEAALAEQQHIRGMHKKRQETELASSIRVAADKLDTLVDLVGELVTVQASLSQKAAFQKDPELLSMAEEVERLTGALRDNTMSIRMLPIGTTFSKFKRLVRDLSNELGKQVVLTTEGGETELDKTVIERLNDPLVHVIRNSIDHGIEDPKVREASGKPHKGTVHLSAAHCGANVVIRISDDGAGLDPQAIRTKAVERGLIAPDAEMSENELFAQIFAPGFSTAGKVTDISGRGVGMDVVKRSIESLRGFIEVDSKKDKGTTITLKLPLTLAIIDGFLVKVGQSSFVLPLSTVEECMELTREDLDRAQGRHIAKVRDEIVPYILLRDLFGIEEQPTGVEQIVVAEVDGHKVGFAVDHVIGEHQTVIKTLGRVFKNAKGFSGATILADGSVALILDVHRLADAAESKERKTYQEALR